MANAFNNPTVFAKEMLLRLKNNCVASSLVHKAYTKEFTQEVNGFKKGGTISLDVPMYARVKDGAAVDLVDLRQRSTTFTLSNRKHIAHTMTAEEMTYDMDTFSEKIIEPVMAAFGNHMDAAILGMYKGIANQVGTPGTTPQTFLTFAQANARLTREGAPQKGRFCMIDSLTSAYMADAFKGLYNRANGPALEQAKLTRVANMDIYESENVATHTAGTVGAVAGLDVAGAASEGDTTIGIDQAASALTIKDGDIFTVAGTNACNPASGDDTGEIRQFVVNEDVTFTDLGAGNYGDAAIAITPGGAPYEIYSNAANEVYLPYQNVVTLPANDATVLFAGTAGGTYKANLAMHKDCVSLACVPLAIPASASWSARYSADGLSVRCYRYLDGANDAEVVRFDILYGLKMLNPFLGTRIAGT